jgi:hypothetical protein
MLFALTSIERIDQADSSFCASTWQLSGGSRLYYCTGTAGALPNQG